jgi:hypothetical protein
MATREQVLALLDHGHSYETAARALKIPAGLAFMIATGLPVDGSGAASPEELEERRVPEGSSQHLLGPPAFNPTGKASVIAWVRERAATELAPPR